MIYKIKDQYLKNTESAYEKGVFGSPSFIFEGEVFWGDDRLEDCIKDTLETNITFLILQFTSNSFARIFVFNI